MAFSNDNGPFNETDRIKTQMQIEQMQKDIKALQESLSSVSAAFDSHKDATYTNEQNPHDTRAIYDNTTALAVLLDNVSSNVSLKADEEELDALKEVVAEKKAIDILNWTPVIAYPKVCDDTFVFLLARLSKDYSQTEASKQPIVFSPKPATLYAKYLNTHSFDACVTASTGDLHVMLNKKDKNGEIRVGIYKGTYSPSGEEDLFIGIKYKDLYLIDNQFKADVPIEVLITGINILPIDSQKQGSISGVTTVKEAVSPAGYSTVPTDISTSYSSNKRPTVITESGLHELALIEDASVPVGAVVRWPSNAVYIPAAYRKCDGSYVGTAEEYIEYAKVFGVTNPAESLYTPIESNSIIKVSA